MNTEQLTTLERKIERFSHILEQRPGDGLTVLALAEASFRRGLKLEALTAYQEVTKEKPVPEAHLAVAEIYSQQNMINEAYLELGKLFEIDPDNVEARLLAHILTEEAEPPEEIAAVLNQTTSDEAFDEARLRLQIQLTIHNRDLQERTRNVTLEPGVVIHEYYVEEAKKKLIEVQEMLRKMQELRRHNEELRLAPRPEPVSAMDDTPEEEPATLPSAPEDTAAAQEVAQFEPAPMSEQAELSVPQEVQTAAVGEAASPELVAPATESQEVPVAAIEQPSVEFAPPAMELQTSAPAAEIAPDPVHASATEAAPSWEDTTAPAEQVASVEQPVPTLPVNQAELVAPPEPAAPPELAAPPEPAAPLEPAAPVEAAASIEPLMPDQAVAPIEPAAPSEPIAFEPAVPTEPVAPMEPAPTPDPVEIDSAPVPEPMPLSAEAPPIVDTEPLVHVDESPQLEIQPLDNSPGESSLEPAVQPVDAIPEPTPVLEPSFPEPSLEPELPEEPAPEILSPVEDSVGTSIELEVPVTIEPDLPEEVPFSAAPPEPHYAPEVIPEPPSQEGYTMPIDIGVDSLVAPDLPDEPMTPEPVSVAPSVVEEPAQPAVQPEPVVQPVAEPVQPEPVIELAPEPVPEPVALDVPPEPAPVEELAPPSPAPSGASSAERQAYYESKAEELGKLTGTLARTRGVTSIFLVSRDGTTIDSVVKDDVTEERIGELVKESFEFLAAYAKNPAYWVLECTGGIFVMQALDDRHVLIAVGQAGANFGALRYTMDKTKAKFATILDNVPG